MYPGKVQSAAAGVCNAELLFDISMAPPKMASTITADTKSTGINGLDPEPDVFLLPAPVFPALLCVIG
jgi:hypothetical protein